MKTHSIFLQAAGDDSVSDPIGKDIIIIAIYVLFLFGALHGVSPKPKDIFRKTHRISSSSSSSDRDRRTKHSNSSDALDKIRFEGLTDKSKLESQVCCLGFYF